MKKLALAVTLLAAAFPAAAHEHAQMQPTSADPVQLLTDPAAQDLVARQVASLAGIVLDTKVGPLATFADPRDRLRPDDTLRSYELRRDPQLDRHIYDSSRRAVSVAGAAVGGAVTEAAELRRTAARLRAALEPLIQAARASDSGQ